MEIQKFLNGVSDDEKDQLNEYYREDLIEELLQNNGDSRGVGGKLPYWEEISQMRFYLQTLEEFVENQKQQQVEQLKQDAKNVPEEKRAEFFAWYYDPRPTEVLSERIRSSFLVSLVSYFEVYLHYVCKDVAVIARSPIKYSELNGNKLERMKKFLKVFGQFTSPSKDDWDLITHIYDVRNVLVHNDSCIVEYHYAKRLQQFVNQQSALSSNGYFLSLEKEFCFFCLEQIKNFLNSLCVEVRHLCERAKRFESKQT